MSTLCHRRQIRSDLGTADDDRLNKDRFAGDGTQIDIHRNAAQFEGGVGLISRRITTVVRISDLRRLATVDLL